MGVLAAASRKIGDTLYGLGFFAKTLRGAGLFFVRGNVSSRILVMQILFTFVEALGITSLLALGIGGAVNIIGIPFLTGLSQERLIYPLLIAIITRELGPLLSAFIICARSATAIATEVAGMVISHEVEAYISVGIDPIEYLAVPRFLAVTISLFLLNVYFSIFGLGGSYLVARLFNPMPAAVYFSNLLHNLSIQDLLISTIKSVISGMIIATVAVIKGFSVERASTEIPVAGLQAVSLSIGLCVAVNLFLSAAYYIIGS
ncbi:MAG: ABC transporter permease [Spirochaetaceae bacterium]|jgi:phospholipid/cholesterol/gamma-HCH transport system permease protein|nr:ABC transporter permease [Spirochaetaceae bacterium]